ncbi:hypothetical protein PGT21_011636 [Puccinia graminis f. sp. tritici]|uniref:Wax synthase domain-containing protein n=1 Tax=Puccinia graminis f. sp. tritici TaxID=56615 RepID=A0A5B0RLL2_PUCGR|nr:hypothetical protein PGT21_011636 [Puccinia graminis f. sp. tritici]KAA1126720.1 hypothetical protein PGTUg99_008753 [Puccinia graminis f. sp. tritici]
MSGLGVFSHLVPLTVQASLFNLVWTRDDYFQKPLIRWARISLLPITLGMMFSELVNLKYQAQLSSHTKLCIGSVITSQAMKSVLFTFKQPASSSPIKTKDHPAPQPPSFLSTLTNVISLVLASSSDPSKREISGTGTNHSIHSDMMFLSKTFRRLLVHHICGIIALACWRGVNDEALIDQLAVGPMIKKFKYEITAFCCGNIIWTNMDLFGCLLRLFWFTSKMINRLLLKLLPSAFKNLPLSEKLNQIDLEETSPPLFKKTPLEATSMTDFWGRHWHQMIRSLVVEAGAVPVTSLLVWVFGTGKLHPKVLRLAGVLAAFTISGLVHEAGVWTAGPIDLTFKTTIFFISQGVAICLENVFKQAFGRKVDGLLGRIWTFSWLVYFGIPMVTLWLNTSLFDQTGLFQKVDELGLLRMSLMPLIVPKLLSHSL